MKKPSRHQTRFVCIQAVINGIITDFNSTLKDHLYHSKINIDEKFCETIYNLVYKHGEMLTDFLQQKITSRNFTTLSTSLKAILYCAYAEMIFTKTHKKVVICEYVTLTKRFISGAHYKLVHAILDSISIE